jgi:hypothetical protein
MKIGNQYVEHLIIPKLYSKTRVVFPKYDYIKIYEIEKEIETELKNDIEFSKYINTKSFKLRSNINN